MQAQMYNVQEQYVSMCSSVVSDQYSSNNSVWTYVLKCLLNLNVLYVRMFITAEHVVC